MKEGIILKEHLGFFAELDPFGILERAYFPDRICVGSVIEDRNGGFDEPAGIMVLKVEENRVVIEWICVRPQVRMRGIGGRLMNLAFKIAAGRGCKEIMAVTAPYEDRDEICPGEKDFLEDYSFSRSEGHFEEYVSDAATLLRSIVPKCSEHEQKKTYALAALLEATEEALIAVSDPDLYRDFMYDGRYCLELSDPDISRILVRGKKIVGGITVQKCEDSLYVTGLAGEYGDCIIPALDAAREAVVKYGKNQIVKLIRYSDSYSGLAKDIFGTDPVVGSFYVADVVNYVKRMMSFEPVESLSNMSAFR